MMFEHEFNSSWYQFRSHARKQVIMVENSVIHIPSLKLTRLTFDLYFEDHILN